MLKRVARAIFEFSFKKSGFLDDYYEIRSKQIPISLIGYIKFRIFKPNKEIYWPVHKNSVVFGNINIGVNSSVGAQPGCYIQGIGKITIGDYTLLAPNVGIISANHDLHNFNNHIIRDVYIGDHCWIGMNSVLLPGVRLGNNTIVGAGSVVTKSFEEGNCVIAGNPARLIRKLTEQEVNNNKDEKEYYGYIPKEKMNDYRKKYLKCKS